VKPQPWSFSRLDAYENCPRQFYETSVAKRYKDAPSPQMLWGREVHTAFEHRLLHDKALPPDLATHEKYLAWFQALPGELAGEERIALNRDLEACGFFADDVWYRGQVDARKRHEAVAFIVDHKTGRVKNDFKQLKTFAIHEFLTQPQIMTVRTEYYWTQTATASGETYQRTQLWDLFNEFRPALERYANSFLTDTWNPKQSGLCAGFCPVTNCEYWRPKRKPR
jgi:hypothetical protein